MSDKKLLRGDNRVIGGVCSAISDKYNIHPGLLRLIFIITTLFFYILPSLIYIILWISIPIKIQIEEKKVKRKHLFQTIGILLGGFLGGYVGYEYAHFSMGSSASKGAIDGMMALAILPIGSIIGFAVVRIRAENKTLNNMG